MTQKSSWYTLIFTSPWFPSVVALLGALAGFWVSLYASEMKSAFESIINIISFGKVTINEPVLIKILGFSLVILFFVSFMLQQHARNKREDESNDKIINESKNLSLLVERLGTMPPAGFLQKAQEIYKEFALLPLFLVVEEEQETEDIARNIRYILSSVCALAKHYDSENKEAKFSANLMLCRSADQLCILPNDQRQFIEKNLIFYNQEIPNPKIDHIYGVLDIVPELTTCYDEVNSDEVVPIALAISKYLYSKDQTNGSRYSVLPGAPFVVHTHNYDCHMSSDDIVKWCDDNSDILWGVRHEIKEYFKRYTGVIEGFISIPIMVRQFDNVPPATFFGAMPKEIQNSSETMYEFVLAVLNIHCDKRNMLLEVGHKHLVPLLEPICSLLAIALLAYDGRCLSASNSEQTDEDDVTFPLNEVRSEK